MSKDNVSLRSILVGCDNALDAGAVGHDLDLEIGVSQGVQLDGLAVLRGAERCLRDFTLHAHCHQSHRQVCRCSHLCSDPFATRRRRVEVYLQRCAASHHPAFRWSRLERVLCSATVHLRCCFATRPHGRSGRRGPTRKWGRHGFDGIACGREACRGGYTRNRAQNHKCRTSIRACCLIN